MRSNIIAITLASNDEKIQVATYATDGKSARMYVRVAPTSDRPAPRWRDFQLMEELSPLKPGVKLGAVAAVQSFFRQKVNNENVEWSIGGVWESELTDKANDDLDAGTAQPQPLFNQLSKKMEEMPPRTLKTDNLHKAAEWFVEGPLAALMKGDSLEKFTQSILSTTTAAPIATTLSAEEQEEGILLKDLGIRFLSRETEYGITDYDLIRLAKKLKKYVLLQGEAGTGKTLLIHAALGEHESVVCTEDTTRADFVGGFVPGADGKLLWIEGPLLRAMKKGIPLYIDEVAMADPRQMVVVYSVMDDRGELAVTENPQYNGGAPLKAAEGFYVIFATNPNAEGAMLSDPLLSRIDFAPEYTTDFNLVAQILGPKHEELITVARSMETMRQNGEVGQALQFRDLVKFKGNHDHINPKFAMAALVARIRGESDREVLRDLIDRVMGVSNIPTFRL